MSEKVATRTTWKNYPIDHPKRIDILFHFTETQFSRIVKGLIPQDMEDKWFIFFENDWLYFHRSWTGSGIFKAKIIREREGYSIKEFWAERNPEKYNSEHDEKDIEMIRILIEKKLLRENAS